MSAYCKEKVLRFPLEGDPWEFEETHTSLFSYGKPGMFQVAPTVKNYIDFVLEYDGDSDGEYGKTRALTENEKEKYRPVWEQIILGIDMNKVRLVEFCWYDCSEAPDYYDDLSDPFYTTEV